MRSTRVCPAAQLEQHVHWHQPARQRHLRTYTAEGITAIAKALKATGSMTQLDVGWNVLGEGGKAVLREAVEGHFGLELKL